MAEASAGTAENCKQWALNYGNYLECVSECKSQFVTVIWYGDGKSAAKKRVEFLS